MQNGKSLALHIARRAEGGLNARQIGIVIAGVRDEFPSAGPNPIEKSMKSHLTECSGAGYAECAARGREAFFREDASPAGLQAAENADLRSANEVAVGGSANCPCRLEWITN